MSANWWYGLVLGALIGVAMYFAIVFALPELGALNWVFS